MANIIFLEAGTAATQDLTFYPTNVGTAISDTVSLGMGPRSAKISTGAGASATTISTPITVLADTGRRISFYTMFDVLPAADTKYITFLKSGLVTEVWNANLTTGGKLNNVPVGATSANGAATLAVNTIYRISIGFHITNSTTYQIKVYINDVLDSTTNAGTLTNTGTASLTFRLQPAAGANRNAWFSNVYVDDGTDDSDTGVVFVTAKRPFSNGSLNQFTTQIGSGGSGYGTGHAPQVNERPLSTVNGWSSLNTTVQTEEYTIEGSTVGDLDISQATIVGYMGWTFSKISSALSSPVHHIIVGGTSTAITLSTAYGLDYKGVTTPTYPAGNTDIGIDAQFTTTARTTSLAECGVLFAYKPKGSFFPFFQ